MNRRELIAAMMTATVASPLVPVLAGETELPVKTVEEIEAELLLKSNGCLLLERLLSS